MLNPTTAPIVIEIVNLFSKYKLPIISRDRVFEDVKLVMDSRFVEPVDDPRSIMNLDNLLEEYSVYQRGGCNKHGDKRKEVDRAIKAALSQAFKNGGKR